MLIASKKQSISYKYTLLIFYNSMYFLYYYYEVKQRLFMVTKQYLKHEMDRGCKKSSVKRIRIHDLRHSHASLLIELGFSPLLIAERLWHEKVEITL